MREELGFRNKLVIGHVGRFSSEKNHNFIVDVFKELKTVKEDSELLLVGEGSQLSSIEKKVNELGLESSVTFTGERKDVNKLLFAMDYFIFPSHFEGLGMALIEAQVSGLCCFASSNILKETDITGNVNFLDTDLGAKFWADLILSKNYDRESNQKDVVIKSAYDINIQAKKLEDYYLRIQ